MKGLAGVACDLCDLASLDGEEIVLANSLCVFASHGTSAEGVLPGAGIVVPREHRESPFELTDAEWAATRRILLDAKRKLDRRYRPDGYNLIWNVGADAGQERAHVHLHVLPRFHDEPQAGRGARWLFKQPTNRRPDPSAPGRGRAVG